MRMARLELAWREPHAPQACVSTIPPHPHRVAKGCLIDPFRLTKYSRFTGGEKSDFQRLIVVVPSAIKTKQWLKRLFRNALLK
jgi:hypothetical protein